MICLVQVWREKNPKSSQRPFCVTTRLCEYHCDKDGNKKTIMKLGLGGNMGIKRQLYSDGNYNSDEDVNCE